MRKVVLTGKAFARFVSYASDGANLRQPREKWKMAMGFLFCQHHQTEIIIADAVGGAFGNQTSVELPPDLYAHIARFEEERPGLFIGGWACSRPGIGLHVTDTDMRNQMYYQSMNPDALALYFDLTRVGPTSLGLLLWRLKDPSSHQYYPITEFSLEGFTRELLQKSLGEAGIDPNIIQQLAEFLKLKDE